MGKGMSRVRSDKGVKGVQRIPQVLLHESGSQLSTDYTKTCAGKKKGNQMRRDKTAGTESESGIQGTQTNMRVRSNTSSEVSSTSLRNMYTKCSEGLG